MTEMELERRALLGDKTAQEECTRLGIALPCPKCGSKWTQVRHMGWPGPAAFRAGYRGECTDCHMITCAHKTEKAALEDWNTRTAPPIGRCKDCAKRKTPRCSMYYECQCGAQHTWETDYDFCSEFEPKGDGENGKD